MASNGHRGCHLDGEDGEISRSLKIYTNGASSLGKSKIGSVQLDYKDSFLRKKQKNQKGIFPGDLSNPSCSSRVIQTGGKFFMFQFFNEVSNDDFKFKTS